MTAYVVFVRETVTDPAALPRYRERSPAARATHPLEPIAFYGPHEVLEGDPVDGVAILKFETMAAARAGYATPGCQAARPHRPQGSTGTLFLVARARMPHAIAFCPVTTIHAVTSVVMVPLEEEDAELAT